MLGFRAIGSYALAAIRSLASGVAINAPSHGIALRSDAPRVASGAAIRPPAASIGLHSDAPAFDTYLRAPQHVVSFHSDLPRVASGSAIRPPAHTVVLSSDRFEINARRRRIKTVAIQS